MQTLWKAKPPLKFTPRYSIFRFTRLYFLLCNSNGVTISVKVVSCVWRSATNLTASYLWGWEGCHGIPKRLATSTFSLTTPFSLSLSSVRNKGTEKVVLWWANIRLWETNQIHRVISKFFYDFPTIFANFIFQVWRTSRKPPKWPCNFWMCRRSYRIQRHPKQLQRHSSQ